MPSTPASRSPSDLIGRIQAAAGPISVSIQAPSGSIAAPFRLALSLYDVAWPFPGELRPADLVIRVADEPIVPADGRYLDAAWLRVDPTDHGLRATGASGAVIEGRFDERGEWWEATLPLDETPFARQREADELVALLLTTGWRRAGWLPLHAAGVERDGRAVLIVASGGGGKTSLALSLVERGWRCLSDDKVLLGRHGGEDVVVGLQHVLHVDPASAAWFPALHAADWWPLMAEGSRKRRVRLQSIWPGRGATLATPAQILVVQRENGFRGIRADPMAASALVLALARQTVLPNDRALVSSAMAAFARLAAEVRGWAVTVGDQAYARRDSAARLEELIGGATPAWT